MGWTRGGSESGRYLGEGSAEFHAGCSVLPSLSLPASSVCWHPFPSSKHLSSWGRKPSPWPPMSLLRGSLANPSPQGLPRPNTGSGCPISFQAPHTTSTPHSASRDTSSQLSPWLPRATTHRSSWDAGLVVPSVPPHAWGVTCASKPQFSLKTDNTCKQMNFTRVPPVPPQAWTLSPLPTSPPK